MNTLSLSQKAVFAVLAVVALYAFAALTWFFSAESAWKKAVRRYEQAKATYQKEERLIADKAKWDTAYETEKAAMPIQRRSAAVMNGLHLRNFSGRNRK